MGKKTRLWTLGNLEHKILPTKEAIDKLRKILSENNDGETIDIVWGPELSVKEVSEYNQEVFVKVDKEDKETLDKLDRIRGKSCNEVIQVEKLNYTLPMEPNDFVESIHYDGGGKRWVNNKTALIFGVTGMDGSHLADLLLEKGYKVVGVKRRSSTNNEWRVNHLKDNKNFSMVSGDLTDYSSLVKVFSDIGNVDEVYNLAAQSHVGESFKQPGVTWDITGKGCMNILQCLVDLKMTHVKFYQASSSEMFGANFDYETTCYEGVDENGNTYGGEAMSRKYQDEDTKHLPQSPYAIAKCAAHMSVRLYREAYGIHGSCGILFNHEGPRRGENFVTRKITKWIAEFDRWLEDRGCDEIDLTFTEDHIVAPDCRRISKLRLGNLEAKRDWGHAKDYVKAMHLMLQQEEPDDYVICTEETRSVKDFLDVAFGCINIPDWNNYVVIDPAFYRPAEVDFLLGDCSKAKRQLNWQREYSFDDLVKEMVNYDIDQTNEKV